MRIGTALFWGLLFFAITFSSCYSSYCEMQVSKSYIEKGYTYRLVGKNWYEARHEWVKEGGVK